MGDVAKHPRLSKRGSVYWFRAKIPARLLAVYSPKREITFSLKTRVFSEAVQRCRVESVKLDQEFAKAEARAHARAASVSVLELDAVEIERLANEHYHARLEEDDEFRFAGTGDQELFMRLGGQLGSNAQKLWSDDQTLSGQGLSEREFSKASASVDLVLLDARQRLARADISLVSDLVDELLEQNECILDRNSSSYRRLALAVLKADVRALEAIQKRNRGEVIDTPRLIGAASESKPNLNCQSPTISQAFDEWKSAHRGPKKTADSFEVAVARFVSLLGDKPIGEITKADIRAYRDALLRFPAKLTKEQRGMPLLQVLESVESNETLNRLSAKTINEKYIAALSAIFALCVNEAGYIEANPCNGIRAKHQSVKTEGRVLYTDEDISTILSFPVYEANDVPKGGAGAAAIWLPLLGMFTGARLEELARLKTHDVATEDGINFISIRPGPDGRRVKNLASFRKVPLHSQLVQEGFLDFVKLVQSDGIGPLFPLLRSSGEQVSASWSKWWGRYARKNGIADSRKVFHSFRHTVKRKLRDARVEKTLRDALLGHAAEDVAESYGLDQDGLGISLPILAEAIERIDYPCFKKFHKNLLGVCYK